jgi:hypothetical protein
MTTKQASKSSGPEDLPVTNHRKIKCRFDRDLGPVESRTDRRFSGIYRAGYAVGAPLDAGVR